MIQKPTRAPRRVFFVGESLEMVRQKCLGLSYQQTKGFAVHPPFRISRFGLVQKLINHLIMFRNYLN